MVLHPWGCILDWSWGCGEGGDAEHPPAWQGLDPAPQQPRQPSQGLHPAPLGAAQRSQRESRSRFPRSPAWHTARCHLCPQRPVRKDRSCLNTPHRQTQGRYFGVPTISVAEPSLLHQPHVSTETCPRPARVTTRVTHVLTGAGDNTCHPRPDRALPCSPRHARACPRWHHTDLGVLCCPAGPACFGGLPLALQLGSARRPLKRCRK